MKISMDGSLDLPALDWQARFGSIAARDALQVRLLIETASPLSGLHSPPSRLLLLRREYFAAAVSTWSCSVSASYPISIPSHPISSRPIPRPRCCPLGAVPSHQASTTKRLTASTALKRLPTTLPRPCPLPPTNSPYIWHGAPEAELLQSRAKHAGSISLRLRQGAHSRLGPRGCGNLGPASDLAQLHLITASSPPQALPSLAAPALFSAAAAAAATPPTRCETCDVIYHGLRDKVPRGFRRRRRV
jgi:hypothetical protein